MPNEHDDDYKVGFRKPPKHTRFKKGQSGNPKGRPPGSKDFGKLLDSALEERVLVKENGRSRRITKRAALAKQMVHLGISGNASVTKAITTPDGALRGSRAPSISTIARAEKVSVVS